MKKKNREALQTALTEFQNAYRIFVDDVRAMQEAEERGFCDPVSQTGQYSYQEWVIKLDVLETTVEQILQDER